MGSSFYDYSCKETAVSIFCFIRAWSKPFIMWKFKASKLKTFLGSDGKLDLTWLMFNIELLLFNIKQIKINCLKSNIMQILFDFLVDVIDIYINKNVLKICLVLVLSLTTLKATNNLLAPPWGKQKIFSNIGFIVFKRSG